VFEGKWTGSGSPEGSFRGPEEEEGNVRGIAAEEGNVFVAEGERGVVSEFDAAGEWVGWITGTPSGPLVEPDGVAVAPSGDVYVADAGAGALDVFGAGVVVADATTDKASKVGKTTVLLNGVVDGDGKPAKYRFEWGSSEAYGSSTPALAAGEGEEKAEAEVTGLAPGSTYHFRLVSENENGTNVGADREFTTLPAVAALSTGPAQGITPTGAELTGSLTPDGLETHYYFQWGTSSSYGQSTPSVNAGSGKEALAATAALTGLAANTVYHYRLVGEDDLGVTYGEDRTFATSGPPRITSEPSTGITHEAASINAKVDPDELETSYHFEYGETTGYGSEVPVGGAKLAAGEVPVAVSAALTHLKIGTTYHFRVVATNSAGTTYEPDQTFTTVPPALIEGTSAVEVSATTARLQAQINPLGHDTTYYFQYGSEPCKTNPAGCTDIPASPGADIGAGEALVAVSQQLSELKPASTYHYRALAVNSLGTSEGPEHTITTQPAQASFALPDDRAWEMVSPPNKHGAPIEALTREGGLILAAEDGDSITYVADGSITEEPEGNRSPEQQQDLSTRTANGWTTQDIATPNTKAQGVAAGAAPEYQFFTPDLSQALVEPWGDTPLSEPPLAAEAKQKTIYIRDDATGTYLPLVTEANVPAGTEFGLKLHAQSATADLSHVILRSEVPLAGPPAAAGLYEWSAGALQFVSLLPDGEPAGLAELGYWHVAARAISSDGSRVIWTVPGEAQEDKRGHLYMSDSETGQTLQLDAAQGVAEPANASAQFQTASSDGSRVFFTDKQRLTADSTADPEHGKPDLYECEIVEEAGKLACHLKDLTVDRGEGEHAAVQGLLLGASEDGSSVYLVAQGVLASNENGDGEVAEPGRDNLYALQEAGGAWTSTFIAGLSSEDSPEWEGNTIANVGFVTARSSPDGRYFAFMSAASPTGYDNVDASPEAKGARDEEVYLYDSQTHALRCVSCDPTGARPVGILDTERSGEGLGLLVDRRGVWARPGHESWLAGNIPGWTEESIAPITPSGLFQSRYLSDEGRLFFNSPDDLVPQATNHVEDVYEYEPTGVGSCESSSGGCVSLISAGDSSKESAFLEATPNGNDVFFLTAAQLLAQDTDTAFDIYDARVCTSESPCLTPPSLAPPGCSAADACRPAEPAQRAPVALSGSATAAGPGNLSHPEGAVLPLKTSKPTVKLLTRAQKLAKALNSCKRQYPHAKKRRARCEAQAKKRYAAKKKAKRASSPISSTHTGGRGRR
jgi:hypothetical protein